MFCTEDSRVTQTNSIIKPYDIQLGGFRRVPSHIPHAPIGNVSSFYDVFGDMRAELKQIYRNGALR